MKTILLLMLITIPVCAQEVVKPIKILLVVPGEDQYDREFEPIMRSALKDLVEEREPGKPKRPRNIVFATYRVDYEITITVAPLDPDTRCVGFAGAMDIEDRSGHRRKSVHTGSDMKSLASFLASKLDRELFQPRR